MSTYQRKCCGAWGFNLGGSQRDAWGTRATEAQIGCTYSSTEQLCHASCTATPERLDSVSFRGMYIDTIKRIDDDIQDLHLRGVQRPEWRALPRGRLLHLLRHQAIPSLPELCDTDDYGETSQLVGSILPPIWACPFGVMLTPHRHTISSSMGTIRVLTRSASSSTLAFFKWAPALRCEIFHDNAQNPMKFASCDQ